MKCGQHIIFDENHHSGVYERVQEKMEKFMISMRILTNMMRKHWSIIPLLR